MAAVNKLIDPLLVFAGSNRGGSQHAPLDEDKASHLLLKSPKRSGLVENYQKTTSLSFKAASSDPAHN